MSKRLVLWIVGGVLICLGSAIAIWGSRTRSEARVSENWPATQGVILTSQVSELVHRQISAGHARRIVHFVPDLRYRYEVDGVSRTGTQYQTPLLMRGDGRGDAQRIVEAHPPGREVQVHYNPQDPSRSVLVRGGAGAATAVLWAGWSLIAGGGITILAAMRRPRPSLGDYGVP